MLETRTWSCVQPPWLRHRSLRGERFASGDSARGNVAELCAMSLTPLRLPPRTENHDTSRVATYSHAGGIRLVVGALSSYRSNARWKSEFMVVEAKSVIVPSL